MKDMPILLNKKLMKPNKELQPELNKQKPKKLPLLKIDLLLILKKKKLYILDINDIHIINYRKKLLENYILSKNSYIYEDEICYEIVKKYYYLKLA